MGRVCTGDWVSLIPLLAFGWGLVLVLRWRPLAELLPINVPWGWKFSGGPKSWSRVSCLWDSGLTP